MTTKNKAIQLLAAFVFFLTQYATAQNDYYFPDSKTLDNNIPAPEQFLGYPIGSFFTRHDNVVAYFKELAKTSNRVHVQVIGKTNENRDQVIITITSPENYNRLEEIRQEHLSQVDPSKPALGSNSPAIVLLGYGVHGNETSSTEASLLAGYYLAASQNPEVLNWLKEAVIFIDPSLNPDGRDRAANWFNAYHSDPPVADPLDKEHLEQWPAGRTNHYFTDLNRDWLSLVQVESRNRVKFFHEWYPNVQIDFHEQGTNATYYFEPSPASHYSPIIPKFLYDEVIALSKYNAQALDNIGSLYFTKEGYDNLSPIYGSTYPKFYGAVAATYEQSSSRGIQQESSNGLLTFQFTIRNHLTTSFSTIRGAVAEKANFFKAQKEFFKYALNEGEKSPVKAYVFGDSADVNLTQKFLSLLLQHHIRVYELNSNVNAGGKTFTKGKAYVVPSAQPNYLIVHSLFEDNILDDSIYYDNTAWNIIEAYGLKYGKITGSFTRGAEVTALNIPAGNIEGGLSNYAYVAGSTDYNTTKALYSLLDKNVLVKIAAKPFTVNTASGIKNYGYGSLVVPVAGQNISPDSLFNVLKEVTAATHINFAAVSTGYSAAGIDLGSSNIRAARKPAVAIAFGQGITSSEAGETWFLLSSQLNLPATKLDLSSFQRASLNRYNVIILPGGSYNTLEKETVEKLKAWVSDGGTLITFQSASAWAIQQNIVKETLKAAAFTGRGGELPVQPTPQAGPRGRQQNKPDTAAASAVAEQSSEKQFNADARLDAARRENVEGAKRVNGAVFISDLDTTHPLAYGITSRKLYINKNGSTILLPSADKYATVAQYSSKPFVNGYAPKASIEGVANSAAIISTSNGRGNVVLFADDPVYRGYWLGTGRILLNALFLPAGTGRFGGQE